MTSAPTALSLTSRLPLQVFTANRIGAYTAESGDRREFSSRSAPIIVGDLREDILALL